MSQAGKLNKLTSLNQAAGLKSDQDTWRQSKLVHNQRLAEEVISLWVASLLTLLVYFLLFTLFDLPPAYIGLIAALVAVSLTILLHARLEFELERVLRPDRLVYRQLVEEYGQIVRETPNLNALLPYITQTLCGVLRLKSAIIWLYQPEDNLLGLACFEGAIIADQLADLPVDFGLKQWPGVCHITALPESALRQGLMNLEIQAVAVLSWGDELVGLIGVGHDHHGHPPGDDLRQVLEVMAGQLTLAVKNARLITDLEETLNKLQLAYRHTIDAQEEERRSLAVELHDDILSRLTTMGMTLSDSQRYLTLDPAKIQPWLEMLGHETHYLNRRLREITQGLHPAVLNDLGLIAALQAYMDTLTKHSLPIATPCTIDLTAQGFNSARIDNQKLERDLYYLTRQALDNALKHSQAEHIFIHLRWREEAVTVTVQDTGIGLKTAPERLMGQHGHLGLLSMHERVLAWRGRLSFQTGPGQGTTVYARLPINQPSPNPTYLQAFTHYLK